MFLLLLLTPRYSTAEGKQLFRVQANVRNNARQFLRMRLPAEHEVWSTVVRGTPVKPATDEEHRLLIPLAKSDGAIVVVRVGNKVGGVGGSGVFQQLGDRQRPLSASRQHFPRFPCRLARPLCMQDVTYLLRREAFGDGGNLVVETPVVDIPISHLFLELCLPSRAPRIVCVCVCVRVCACVRVRAFGL